MGRKFLYNGVNFIKLKFLSLLRQGNKSSIFNSVSNPIDSS